MNRLIAGINPITISSIKLVKFRRLGPHPSWTKIMKKKNPIRGFLGLYSPQLFDGIIRPHVSIRGAAGREIKYIFCSSNDAAMALHDKLNRELNDFLNALTVKDIRNV